MAKLIPYQPDRTRKPGFRKVKKPVQADHRQLNLFGRDDQTHIIRHIDPFQKGLEIDDNNERLAVKFYLEATKKEDSAPDAFCNLGIIYAKQGKSSQAIDSFTKALVQNPRHTIAHYNLGNMYYDAGNHKLAQIHYEVASKMEDVFPEVFYNLSLSYLTLGENDSASVTLQKYIERVDDIEAIQAKKLLALLQI